MAALSPDQIIALSALSGVMAVCALWAIGNALERLILRGEG